MQAGTVNVTGFQISKGAGTGGQGGGLFNSAAALTVTNCTFADNTAVTGGGIYDSSQRSVTIAGSTFTGNSAVGDGGAIANEGGGGMTLTGSTLTGNSAVSGGAIADAGPLTIIGSTLSGNQAISNNTGGGAGGALLVLDGAVGITNSTLAGNTANVDGGAIFNGGAARTTITGSTVSGNHGSTGLVSNFGGFAITASILSQSSASGGSCLGSITDGGDNVESDNTCGFSIANGDLVNSPTIDLAGSLAANGSTGPQTIAIGPGSSAIGRVPNSLCTAAISAGGLGGTDERGLPRPGISGLANCAAGAFELQGVAQAPTITSANSTTFTSGTGTGTFTVTTSAGAFPTPSIGAAGSLPTGIHLVDNNDGTATLSGTTTAAAGNYPITITADNGVSPAASQAFTLTVVSVPGAPTGVSALAGNTAAVVSFSAPGSDGGSPITTYTITSSGGQTCTIHAPFTTPLSCTVTGLSNAVAYTFTVTATNSAGTGAPSTASAPATPFSSRTIWCDRHTGPHHHPEPVLCPNGN